MKSILEMLPWVLFIAIVVIFSVSYTAESMRVADEIEIIEVEIESSGMEKTGLFSKSYSFFTDGGSTQKIKGLYYGKIHLEKHIYYTGDSIEKIEYKYVSDLIN